MQPRPLLLIGAATLLACGLALGVAWLAGDSAPQANGGATRIVCLMPPITDTLCQLGAREAMVGRSDYCLYPPEVLDLPVCGTTLHPNLETIARLQPTRIVGEASINAARGPLNSLAPATFLPWLTREDVIASTRELGRLCAREAEAEAMAAEIEAALPAAAPASGPRVLLALPHSPGQMHEVWFMRRNCLHGAILHAAGARNAVDEDVHGTPSLSLEKLLELQPDIVIVLHHRHELPDAAREQILADWRDLSVLQAAREGRVGVLAGRQNYPAGRDIIALVAILRAEIERLSHE